MILETERLRLRQWLTADAEALYRYACDPAAFGCDRLRRGQKPNSVAALPWKIASVSA